MPARGNQEIEYHPIENIKRIILVIRVIRSYSIFLPVVHIVKGGPVGGDRGVRQVSGMSLTAGAILLRREYGGVDCHLNFSQSITFLAAYITGLISSRLFYFLEMCGRFLLFSRHIWRNFTENCPFQGNSIQVILQVNFLVNFPVISC